MRIICCQVPSCRVPREKGTASDGPRRAARTCENPLPSPHRSSWLYCIYCGTIRSIAALRSAIAPFSNSIVVIPAVDPGTNTVTIPRVRRDEDRNSWTPLVMSCASENPFVFRFNVVVCTDILPPGFTRKVAFDFFRKEGKLFEEQLQQGHANSCAYRYPWPLPKSR